MLKTVREVEVVRSLLTVKDQIRERQRRCLNVVVKLFPCESKSQVLNNLFLIAGEVADFPLNDVSLIRI